MRALHPETCTVEDIELQKLRDGFESRGGVQRSILLHGEHGTGCELCPAPERLQSPCTRHSTLDATSECMCDLAPVFSWRRAPQEAS
jgi:hypothetical protein